ncbi:uncharacterized protein BT62DRAFT_253561 [Guyanagaster necrorhizus]|uniref:Secreted protein n=1 Tax=Guyanagaster necrorhizus TaxID=856835 RepID=A0A9P8AQM2_9AGAR|nr:uncharacterized protein BT62DRAFT_253561 [Guyanagaster necrorhizus MCA 3950]KAG7444140.1 hypothetical protein BT62DRAFT_253561 [Guyanagaster necrorhizus MCA 3950]
MHATLLAILCCVLSQSKWVQAGYISQQSSSRHLGSMCLTRMIQISLSTAIFSIEPGARARLNVVFIFSVRGIGGRRIGTTRLTLIQLFLVQVMGTSAGTKVFVRYGWGGAGNFLFCYFADLIVSTERGLDMRVVLRRTKASSKRRATTST